MAQTISVLGIDIATLVFHAVGMDNAGTRPQDLQPPGLGEGAPS
jgi:hypothetical protein